MRATLDSEDLIDGEGLYNFKNRDSYNGQWEKGKMHGRGKTSGNARRTLPVISTLRLRFQPILQVYTRMPTTRLTRGIGTRVGVMARATTPSRTSTNISSDASTASSSASVKLSSHSEWWFARLWGCVLFYLKGRVSMLSAEPDRAPFLARILAFAFVSLVSR